MGIFDDFSVHAPLIIPSIFSISHRLKGILYFISLSQIRINPESRAYYDRKRNEGKTHWQAMNALSRQLIKIIYYILKDKVPYQRSPLVN